MKTALFDTLHTKRILLQLLVFMLFVSCDYKENEVVPTSEFVKYIDTQTADDEIFPLDFKATPDGGYLVFALLNQKQAYFIKLNELGDVVWENTIPAPYFYPCESLLEIGGKFYVLTFNDNGIESSYLFEINASNGDINQTRQLAELVSPLAVSATPSGGLLVQSYDADGRKTIISKYSSAGARIWQRGFDVGEDKTALIYSHVERLSEPLPFFTTTLTNNGNEEYHVFNGLYNFNLGLVFLDRNGNETGIIQGFRYDAYINSIFQLNNTQIALSRYPQEGNPVLLPQSPLSAVGFTQGTELGGEKAAAWEERQRIYVNTINIDGVAYVCYAGNTKSGKVELRFYDASSSNFVFSKFIGTDYYTGYGKYLQNAAGELTVLSQVALEDRFLKLVLHKYSATTLSSFLGKEEE